MTISVNDRRLLTGKKSTLKKLQKLTVDGPEATKALEAARTVLSESIEEYDRAIRREDLTDEVREILQGPRGKASEALVRVYYTLKRQYAERRARGEALTERDKKVEEFLRSLSPTEYVTASFPTAVSTLERAVDFASQNLPDELVNVSRSALDRAQEARNRLEELGERALKSYSNVEKARGRAKDNYLAVRELTSAALRLEGRFNELNKIAPPVSDIMSPSEE
jgi:CHASE3 domain sensor protein